MNDISLFDTIKCRVVWIYRTILYRWCDVTGGQ